MSIFITYISSGPCCQTNLYVRHMSSTSSIICLVTFYKGSSKVLVKRERSLYRESYIGAGHCIAPEKTDNDLEPTAKQHKFPDRQPAVTENSLLEKLLPGPAKLRLRGVDKYWRPSHSIEEVHTAYLIHWGKQGNIGRLLSLNGSATHTIYISMIKWLMHYS